MEFTSLTTSFCTISGSAVSFIAAGSCQVAANQSGNQNYNAALQVTQSMTVASAPALAATTTTIASSGNPSTVGQSVTFTATVKRTSNNTVATSGTVTFKEGATVLAGPIALNASGEASFTALGLTASSSSNPVLTVGTYTISAVYSGTAIYATSTGSISQVVAKIPTTTVVVSSKNPSNSNQTVTFTATVKRQRAGCHDRKGDLQRRADDPRGADRCKRKRYVSFSISNLSQGNHTISAIYGPTDTHETGTGTVTQSVKK